MKTGLDKYGMPFVEHGCPITTDAGMEFAKALGTSAYIHEFECGGDRDGAAHVHSDCQLVEAWGWVDVLIGQGNMMAHDLWEDWSETGGPRSMRSEWAAVKRDILRTRPR